VKKLEIVMNWNKSLSRVLAGTVASLAAVNAYAMPKGPCEKPAEVCCDEPKPGPFAFSYPKDVDLACPADFYVNAAFLILQAKEDGLDFGVRDNDGPTLPLDHGELLGFSYDSDDYDYNPGVRVGLGFYLHHDAWTLDFDWTWLNITNYQDFGVSNGTVILPIWLPPVQEGSSSNVGRSISSSWNAHYNTVDARLGKPYHVSRYVVFKPHFGLRAGWIEQSFSVHHNGVYNGQVDAIHYASNDFWGIGTRAGLESEWIVGKGWQLFGNVAGSILFGQFHIDQDVGLGTASSGSGDLGYDLNHKFYQNVPNVEIELGIAWHKFFNKNKYRVGLAAAYEFHEWFDQFNLTRFFGYTTSASSYQWQLDTTARGNLTLNGFSVKLQLDM
jgi:hypothetical protein